ncbi:hypothetical protein [Chromobacterium sp. IIBBL 290-4]|uniref:hypothetical protein n=1 Tax=Chromobacterium sp. IIBBL 290-4 TaxID=2953890 RepID=UPI0020B6A705|nr:hypothetical protein [Chromobacterium sp. IIBBL 290-4]UTH74887.1 hypothetical protein NKT35_01915 [Chromobacterium sp. IIBBL 290-4]
MKENELETLAAYARAIMGGAGAERIVGREERRDSWREADCEVTLQERDYRFDNGVVIRRGIEMDDFPSELACSECWITYEVLELGCSPGIEPARKSFDNACREAFWLRYHAEASV